MIICDTGPLVAAALANDDHREASVALFNELHRTGRPLLVPATVAAEVGYTLDRKAGPEVEAAFLSALADGSFTPVDLTSADYRRASALVRQYADFPLGTTDASVIALAERLKLTEVATIDHRHFLAVRPAHVATFVLRPP